MRTPIIAGNWKLNKTLGEAKEFVIALGKGIQEATDVEVIVAPSSTALHVVAEQAAGTGLAVAAQNCYPQMKGAFTGELSPMLLKDAGCRYVIIGHSERRQLFHETDGFINEKVQATFAAGLVPILCIGESAEERQSEQTFAVLKSQLVQGMRGLDANQVTQLVVAYEPVWAIGTGQAASSQQAEEVHAFLRKVLGEEYGDTAADQTRLLYGGSVTPENVDELMACTNIDGALVGGASLQVESFLRIVCFTH